jgi:uncharacterized protein YgiM (DUF1202 family)
MNHTFKNRARQLFGAIVLATSVVFVPMIQAQSTPTYTTSGTVNVRSGDGRQYSIIATVNGVLTVTGRNNFDANFVCTGNATTDNANWLRVDNNGVEGWVALCAGDFDGSLASIGVVSPSNAVLTSDLEREPNYAEGNLLGDEPQGKFVVAYARGLFVNVRENPSRSANKLGVLRTVEGVDTAVYVIGRTGDGFWAQVQYVDEGNTITGWVARYLLHLPQGWTTQVDVR